MSVRGVGNRPPVSTASVEDRSLPLVQTTSASDHSGILLLPTTTNAGDGDLPLLTNTTADETASQLARLQELLAQLQPLAAQGDQQAIQLIAEINQAIAELERQVETEEAVESSDTDGDGIADLSDPDADGDNITNNRELVEGTDPLSDDTDGDGITDDNEIRLHNLGIQLGDQALAQLGNARDPDANGNGILDSAELERSVRVQLGMEVPEGSGPSGGVGTTSQGAAQPARWGEPPAGATTINLADPAGPNQELPSGSGSYIIQTPPQGTLRVSQHGSSLWIENGSRRVVVPNFEQKKLYFYGTGQVQFSNFDPATIGSVNTAGYAQSGIYIASGTDSWAQGTVTTTNVVTPFDNLAPEGDTTIDDVRELTFNLSGLSGLNFNMRGRLNNEEAKQWTIRPDGEGVIVVEARNREGEPLMRFRLENARADQIDFHLDDSGIRVDSQIAARIHGGSGDDLIYSVAGEGSNIEGGAGNDMIVISGDADGTTVRGGSGNDILQGSDGADRLQGDEGNDFIYGALGENQLLGGAGNDAIFTANTMHETGSRETVDGGTGLDLSNAYNGTVSGIETGIQDLNGLQTYLAQYASDSSTPIELSEILRLQREGGELEYAQQLVAENLESLALHYLMAKDTERQSDYEPLPSATTPPAGLPPEAPAGSYAPQPDSEEADAFYQSFFE